MYEKGYTEAQNINWHKAITKFDGATQQYLQQIFNNLLLKAKETTGQTELGGRIEFENFIVRITAIL